MGPANESRIERRTFLRYGGATGTLFLAGCSGGGDGGDGGGDGGSDGSGSGGDGSDGGDSNDGGKTATQQLADSITMYTSSPTKSLYDAFTERTGVEVNFSTFKGSRVGSKIESEVSAGNIQVDIADAPVMSLTSLFTGDTQYFQEVDLQSPEKLYHSDFQNILQNTHGDRAIYPYALNLPTFVYNTSTVSDPPTGFEDFLDDRFEDAIGTPAFIYPFAYAFFQQTGQKEFFEDYVAKLDNQGVQYFGGNAPIVQNIISENIDLGWYILESTPIEFIEKGAPVDVTFPPKVHVFTSVYGVLNQAPHEQAAKEYVKFVTSEEGQKAVQEEGAGRLPMWAGMSHGHDDVRKQIEEDVEDLVFVMFTAQEFKEHNQRVTELVDVQD